MNYLNPTSIIIQLFVSNWIKNYQTIQIIKFLSFKSSKFFKFQIDIDTKPALFILVKIRALNVSNFQTILVQLSQLSKAVNKNISMATISYCFCKNCNPIWKIEKFKSWKFTTLKKLFNSTFFSCNQISVNSLNHFHNFITQLFELLRSLSNTYFQLTKLLNYN